MPLEPQDFIVLFTDILGFSRLTELSEKSMYPGITPPMFSAIDHGETILDITGLQNRPSAYATYHFHAAVETQLRAHARANAIITGMTFSDSAFIVLKSVPSIATTARRIMRDCLRRKVAVRMGIGKGSFRTVRFRADTNPNVHIYGAQFYGTAIVRAHIAEGVEAGMRIFVHPSLEPHLDELTRGGRSHVLPLRSPTSSAQWELEYLTDYGDKPWHDRIVDEDECARIWSNVNAMKAMLTEEDREVPRVVAQYTETLVALNRMRDSFSLARYV